MMRITVTRGLSRDYEYSLLARAAGRGSSVSILLNAATANSEDA